MSTFKVGDRVKFNPTGDLATVAYVTTPPVDVVIITYDDGVSCSVNPYALTKENN